MLNSLTNPILYFYRNAWLRKAVLEVLNMRKPVENKFPPNEVPQVVNVVQSNSTLAKLNVMEPGGLLMEPNMERQETSNAMRSKIALIDSHRVMAWQ